MNIVKKAEKFAKDKHTGQFRITGEEYIVHPIKVAKIVKKYKDSHKINDLLAAALLHDTLEDTETNYSELKKEFNKIIADIVLELTSDNKEIEIVGKTNYLSNKLSNPKKMSDWALVIKLADRLDNISNLELAKKEFRDRYLKETKDIINYLKKNRKATETQKRIIKAIERKLSEYN